MLVPRVTEECTLTKASIWTTQMGETFTAAFKVVQLDKALVSVLPTSFLSTHRITLLYFPELCILPSPTSIYTTTRTRKERNSSYFIRDM